MPTELLPLETLVFDADQLMRDHPPVVRNANKRIVFDIACPAESRFGGQMGYSRWATADLPERVGPFDTRALVEGRPDVYDYAPAEPNASAVEWHVNFADPHLFVAYSGDLFAQDEMQVAEHPALGALREALDAGGYPALTVEGGMPTPVTISGVERRCSVATDRNASEGRPQGLYGNAFARADPETIRRATKPLDPPTITNLLAMAAPPGGFGPYDGATIRDIIVTAYTGFSAAVQESRRLAAGATTIVHTGHWGCGAFGGNRVLMAMLQIASAHLAGLGRLVFHTFDAAGVQPLAEATEILEQMSEPGGMPMDAFIGRLEAIGFEWGVSDGN